MKQVILLTFVLFNYTVFCQPWYSKIFDPFQGKQESVTNVFQENDTLFFRDRTICSSGDKLCSQVGRYSIGQNSIIDIRHFDNIQGGKNLLLFDNRVYLPSEESLLQQNISLSWLDQESLDYMGTIDLAINDNRFTNYTIKSSLTFSDKIIIGAQALDNQTQIDYQGWHGPQENAVFFFLNRDLEVDTILILPPSSGAFLKIEDISIGPDSIIYISFYEFYLKSGPSEDFLENRKVIYGFDKNYNKVFQWIGPDFYNQESQSFLAIGLDTTIYLNYKKGYHSYVAALKPNGVVKWDCLLDPVIGISLYSIKKIILAVNGDIVGSGVVSSVGSELGESGLLFRINGNGDLLWKKAIRVNKGFDLTVPTNQPYQTGFEDLIECPNGDLLATGYVRRFVSLNEPGGPHNFDLWFVRTSSSGCLWEDCNYIQDIVTKPNFIPVVSPANEWVVDILSPFFPPFIYKYTFSADTTLISGEYFHELLYSDSPYNNWNGTGSYYRQDNSKVFRSEDQFGFDLKLLYDFDFIIGDTLEPHQDGSNNHREIVETGTTTLLDGILRKFLILECTRDKGHDSTTWIEGMGDISELFWTNSFCSAIDGDGTIRSIRCFSTNGELLYLRPDLDGCLTTSINEASIPAAKVYPNPSSGVIYLDIESESPYSVVLYDILGNVVTEPTMSPNVRNQLDVSSLNSGLYYGKLIFRDKSIQTFKFTLVK